MNSFTCLPSSVCTLQELGEEPRKQLPAGQLHCSHFNQKGCWGTGMLGSVCKAAQESWSRLVTRQPGGRKVSGRVCLTALESGFTKRSQFLESRSWWRDWGFTSGFTLPRANPWIQRSASSFPVAFWPYVFFHISRVWSNVHFPQCGQFIPSLLSLGEFPHPSALSIVVTSSTRLPLSSLPQNSPKSTVHRFHVCCLAWSLGWDPWGQGYWHWAVSGPQ